MGSPCGPWQRGAPAVTPYPAFGLTFNKGVNECLET